jgi:predicted O-methyltransferase YrrM
MSPADFEALYRTDPDPWGYETSQYEREKYAETLAACGPGPFARALELGSSIGVFSELLAPRCRSLITLDSARSAVTAAQSRLAAHPQARALLGEIPEAIPSGSYDLVLTSEILYYLEPDALSATLDALEQRTEPGARLVAVHWRPPGPERPFDAAAVHARLRREPWLTARGSRDTADYLLDVLERV